jgi:phenylacetate-CoA ligase
MEENRKPAVALNDRERFPLINNLSFLMKMRQDEFAPIFNFQSGDRLEKNHLEQVNQYAKRIRGSKKFWKKGAVPDWLADYLSWCIKTVPYYKKRADSFENQPTINRGVINSIPWQFVSSESNLDDLLVYQTSGTTGPPMDVVFDPVSQACWLPQLQSILDQFDITLDSNPDVVSIALICSQSSTLTYASLSTYLNGAGVLKINLNPDEWKVPSHSIKYLEKYNPQVLTGDPFTFMELLNLKPNITPKVLVSSAMKLTEGVRKKLEEFFLCPIVDIYSLTECRMIAFAKDNKYKAIRSDLYLEVFDKDKDILLPYGERGELVVTGGINPFLPLIRYRTGDFCKLEIENDIPYLIDLEARTPVAFYSRKGKFINNIDISRKMTDHFEKLVEKK